MSKAHYHNTSESPVYIGGVMIPPGASREVNARLVPGATAPAVAQEPEVDAIAALLDGTVKEIEAALEGLSDEDLAKAEAAERAGKDRKGVIEALAEETLRRAAAGDADSE